MLLIALSFLLAAAEPEWLWVRQIEGRNIDYVSSLVVDSKGNCYVAGWFGETVKIGSQSLTSTQNESGVYYLNIFVAKLDPAGKCLWAKSINGFSGDFDDPVLLSLDQDENCCVAGAVRGNTYFDQIKLVGKSEYENYSFLAKVTPSGKWLWASKIDGYATGLDVDARGNIFLANMKINPTETLYDSLSGLALGDAWLMKFDSQSKAIWANKVGSGQQNPGAAIKVDDQGNCYLGGSFSSALGAKGKMLSSKRHSDLFVLKIDPAGRWLWTRQGGGKGPDQLNKFWIDDRDRIVIEGLCSDNATFGALKPTRNNPGIDANIRARLDTKGNWIAAETTNPENYHYTAQAADAAGNFYVGGTMSGHIILGPYSLSSTKTNKGFYSQDAYVAKIKADEFASVEPPINSTEFVRAFFEDDLASCDSMLKKGFPLDYFAEDIENEMMHLIYDFGLRYDDIFYSGKDAEEEMAETIYEAEQGLIELLLRMKAYKIALSRKTQLLNGGRNLTRLNAAIRKYPY